MIRRTGLSRRWGATILPSLLSLLLLAGCMPIQPPTTTTVSAVPTAQAEPAAADALAGDWEGSIAIAGIELGIILHMVQEGDAWRATLDIRDQSAMGLPVGNLEVTLPEVRFTILDGAQQALSGAWVIARAGIPLSSG